MNKRIHLIALALVLGIGASAQFLQQLPISGRMIQLKQQRTELIEEISAQEESRNEQLLEAVETLHATPANIEEINDRHDHRILELKSQLTDIELELLALDRPTSETTPQVSGLLDQIRQNFPSRDTNQTPSNPSTQRE